MKSTKQATRGQAQIHRENQQTVRHYSLASTFGTGLYVVLHLLLFGSSSWSAWFGFAVSVVLELLALALMMSSTRCLKGEKGQIVDAGVDLNDTHSFGEYYKDTIIFCVIVQLLALISSYFLLLLFTFPTYAFYKLWVNIIGPWIFAPPPPEDPMEEKRMRRRQKVVYRR